MKQYNHKTDSAMGDVFCVVDYEKADFGPNKKFSVNIIHTDGKTYATSMGWARDIAEANGIVREVAHNMGLKLTGYERVA